MTMLVDDSILFDLLLGNPQALEWLVIQRDLSIAAAAGALSQQSPLPLHDALLLATARAHGLRDVVHAYQRNTSPTASS